MYNALGQQVVRRLTQTGQTIHSIHDLDGNRIAEYDFDAVAGTSTLLREYVWLNGLPISVIEGGVTYYIRTDHIGRPVFATDDAGAKVWEATYLPFGGVHTSSGANIDLRFPGQWFQSENGLHQNWMRDYDPTTGRYIQADPLGLVDGASVYGYALQNPGRYTDPRGLQTLPVFGGGGGLGPVSGVAPGTPLGDLLGQSILDIFGNFRGQPYPQVISPQAIPKQIPDNINAPPCGPEECINVGNVRADRFYFDVSGRPPSGLLCVYYCPITGLHGYTETSMRSVTVCPPVVPWSAVTTLTASQKFKFSILGVKF